jgi:hypothetical protein
MSDMRKDNAMNRSIRDLMQVPEEEHDLKWLKDS